MAKSTTLPTFQDRVKELIRIKPSEIVVNEENWHEHPPEQIDFFLGVLSEIGFAGVVMVFKNEDGKYELIDGEMRQTITSGGDQPIPAIVLDVTRDEAKKLLAFHDKIGEMGITNDEKLYLLLGSIEVDDASLSKNIDLLLAGLDVDEPEKEEEEGTAVKQMELLPHEHYDYVIVLARTQQDWGRLHDMLGLETIRYGRSKTQIGIGRAIEANYLINMLMEARGEKNWHETENAVPQAELNAELDLLEPPTDGEPETDDEPAKPPKKTKKTKKE